MSDFWVNGIVSQRDKQPYIQLSNEKGMIAQLSIGQARKIALDILVMSARTEMDAMVREFFIGIAPEGEGNNAADSAMMLFRDYRHKLDQEKVEGSEQNPDTGEIV